MLRRSMHRLSVGGVVGVECGTRFAEGWNFGFVNADNHNERRSPWHHIDLKSEKTSAGAPLFHFLNEIPKGERAKLEVSTKTPFNPIVQDRVKKTKALRCFTYGDLPFNYGCLPQTWEDPSHVEAETGCRGDGDPVDVVEISGVPLAVGSISAIRVLGVLALIDEGETDWKIIALCAEAALSMGWTTLADVPPSILADITHWFRFYKTTDGKPENQFAFGGVVQKEDKALSVVNACHGQYRNLLSGSTPNPGLWVPPPAHLP